jgi:hypothetical protein
MCRVCTARTPLWSDELSAENIPLPTTLVIGGKEIDGRTIPARRYRSLCTDLARDMGDDPSAAQWLLICRCAALTVQAELLDQQIVTGGEVDVAAYTALTGALTRTLKTLGLERRAKDISPAATIDAHAAAVRESTYNYKVTDDSDD